MALSFKFTDAERRVHTNRNPPQTLCDYSCCGNVAIEVVGFVRELNRRFVICAKHLDMAKHTAKSKS